MKKEYFMKKTKREAYKDLKLYFEIKSEIYDLFIQNIKIIETEKDILSYIQYMTITDFMEMILFIVRKYDALDLKESCSNNLLLKSMMILYVKEEMRYIEE